MVSSGMAQTMTSIWPEYANSGRYFAFVLDARYHQAKASVAAIVGSTMASMIATESSRMVLSAVPTGPCGSRRPDEQAVRNSGAPASPRRKRRVPAYVRTGENRRGSGSVCFIKTHWM